MGKILVSGIESTEGHMTSPEKTVTLPESQLFFRAVCCLISADGKVRSQDAAVLSEAMNRLGFRLTADQLREQVVSTCKDIHAKGVDRESAALAANLRSLAKSPLAAHLRQVIESFTENDGIAAEKKRLVAAQFQQALTGPSATSPPPLASSKQIVARAAKPSASTVQSTERVDNLNRLDWKWIFPIVAVGIGLGFLRSNLRTPTKASKSTTKQAVTAEGAENEALRRKVADLERSQQAAAQQAAAQQAAAQQAAANQREQALKVFANACASHADEAFGQLDRGQRSVRRPSYNELYAEIYTKLDAETAGLKGDELTKAAKAVAATWADSLTQKIVDFGKALK